MAHVGTWAGTPGAFTIIMENDTGAHEGLDQAYYDKQIRRLLESAERLVERYEGRIDKLGPMACLEALDRVLGLAERLEARRDGRKTEGQHEVFIRLPWAEGESDEDEKGSPADQAG